MATPSSPQHEPTMEEILASIRKIISEDSTEPQMPAPTPEPVVAAAPAAAHAEADVLELTEEVAEAPAPIVQPAPVQQAAPPPPAREPIRPPDEVIFQNIDDTLTTPAKPQPAPEHSAEELVSDRARQAVDTALSDLDLGRNEEIAEPVAPIDGRSVEAVFERAVRETFDPVLRAWLQENANQIVTRMVPAIRDWMDDHLPTMIKAAVEAEVMRAVKARTRR